MEQENDSSLDEQVSKRILEKYYKLISSEGLKRSANDPLLTASTQSVQYFPKAADTPAEGAGALISGYYLYVSTGASLSGSNAAEEVQNSTIAQIQRDNQQLVNSVRERAQQQINQLQRERDTLLYYSRESILYLQTELEQAKRRLTRLQGEHSRALADMEQLKHVYDTRQAGLLDKLQIAERGNAYYQQEIRGLHEEMRAFYETQQNSFNERIKVVEQSQRYTVAQLTQRLKTTQAQLQQSEQDKLLLLKYAAADMCKLNDCIEGQRDKISQLKTYTKQLKSELMIIQHERDMSCEQNRSSQLEIESLRRRNENLTRELLRVDKMIYGRTRK